MSSSNPRGGGQSSSRYGNEYSDYGKSRRKNFFSSSTTSASIKSNTNSTTNNTTSSSSVPSLSRRDFKSNGPGSSSLTHSKDPSSNTSNRPTSSSYSSSNYYSNSYGNYDTSYYNGRTDNWRKSSSKAGDSRLSMSSHKPTGSASSSASTTTSNSSLISPSTNYRNGNSDYRKDRYDSYSTPETGSKWKRSSQSTRFSAKDRIRKGKNPVTSSYTSGSNNVPLGSSNPNIESYRSSNYSTDPYYTSSKSYGSYYSKTVDRYSSASQFKNSNSYSKPRDKYKYSNYGKSTLINPAEKRAKEYEIEGNEDQDGEDGDQEDDQDESEEEMQEQEENVDNIDSKESLIKDEKTETTKIEPKIQSEELDEEIEEESEVDNIESKLKSAKTPPPLLPIKEEIKYDIAKDDSKSEVEGLYKYPLPKLQQQFEDMQIQFLNDQSNLKYKNEKPVNSFLDYSFYINNYVDFKQKKEKLIQLVSGKEKELRLKTLKLWNTYNNLSKKADIARTKMDQQLRVIHPADDEMRKEIDSSDLKKQNQQIVSANTNNNASPVLDSPVTVSSRRSSRRHGDLVTTEAEFQEILLTLGQQQDDPLEKARRVAADIPDLILDPIKKKNLNFMDSNNIVKDKTEWSQRVKSDFYNTFSDREHELFSEAFCLFPKRFGAISRYMGGLRTASDCVVHYYMTKKAINYKQLLIQHRKASKKSKKAKNGVRIKTVNVTNNSSELTQNDEGPIVSQEITIAEGEQNSVSTEGTPLELQTPNVATPIISANTDSIVQEQPLPPPAQEIVGKKRASAKPKTERKRPAKVKEVGPDGQPFEKKKRKSKKAEGEPVEKKKRVKKTQPVATEYILPATGKISIETLTTSDQQPQAGINPPSLQSFSHQQQPQQSPAQQYAQLLQQYPNSQQQQHQQQQQYQYQQQQQQYQHYQQYPPPSLPQYQQYSQRVPQQQQPQYYSSSVFPSIRNLISDQHQSQPLPSPPPPPPPSNSYKQQNSFSNILNSSSSSVPTRKSSIMNLLNNEEPSRQPQIQQQQQPQMHPLHFQHQASMQHPPQYQSQAQFQQHQHQQPVIQQPPPHNPQQHSQQPQQQQRTKTNLRDLLN
ncbi:SNT1 [Candida pseudojiufengensis]|uniref:SNT1 n=1 Tax=Candida pseudojiufengensis TaxID=497109 RepID=UPI0022258C0C|nr:SNT1 [Candida pseudojiufengensis]KAI5961450.1 SNT1 [Candida pseudojiufengensis]